MLNVIGRLIDWSIDWLIDWLIDTFAYEGVVAYGGLLYVVGGDDGSSNLSSVECYNPKSDTWTMLPSSLTIGRSYAGVSVIVRPIWLNWLLLSRCGTNK